MPRRRREMHLAFRHALEIVRAAKMAAADAEPVGPVAKLTPAARRALSIVKASPSITAGRFSQLMWPDSDGHHVHSNVGRHGSATGVAIKQAGGAFLSRLDKRGLVVYIERTARITKAGLAALAAAESKDAK